MGKIAPISNKYIIYAKIYIEGVVERPDVIGAIFGQTEGLLGSDLELRELQKSGRIARIDVNLNVKQGKTEGEIIIPSSLDKTETALIAAAIETITKIGPCDSKIEVEKIEDVRVSKRNFLMERAKNLLKDLNQNVLPDSQEITTQISDSMKTTEITTYGKDRLPAGPNIDNSDEIILVEGRADVLVLLKSGFKNVIGIGGTSIPETVKELCKEKTIVAFVDGDRGGDLIIKELVNVGKVDFVIKAPDGKEVEELTQKEVYKAMRGKITYQEYSGNSGRRPRREKKSSYEERDYERKEKPSYERRERSSDRGERSYERRDSGRKFTKRQKISLEEAAKFKEILDELVGTKGAFILNNDLNILGKVPIKELANTIKSLRTGMYAVIIDGVIDNEIVYASERAGIKYLVANDTEVTRSNVNIITVKDLEAIQGK